LEEDVMKALLQAFDQSDWQEMTVMIGGDRLHVSRLGSSDGPPPPSAPQPAGAVPPPAPEAAPPASAPAASAPPVSAASAGSNGAIEIPPGTQISAPSVGLFWRAPSPGAPPFVEVGSPVAAGETVAIVEVMKLMNHVTAPVSGTVSAVLAENGQAVEFGQVLVVVDAEA
jgi:acetyl-CoA carboxylase biotin carboxyl carrier protein